MRNGNNYHKHIGLEVLEQALLRFKDQSSVQETMLVQRLPLHRPLLYNYVLLIFATLLMPKILFFGNAFFKQSRFYFFKI